MRRWRCLAIVIFLAAVETTTMTQGGRSRTHRTPMQTRCPSTDSRQRGESVTPMTAAATNLSTGVSGLGVRIMQIPGMGDSGIHSAMAAMTMRTMKVNRIPSHGRRQCASLRQG